jgi:UDP-N-acetylglucosamine 2-epimerase (hydrolysing)
LDEYSRLKGLSKIKVLPSMRFEYFLTLLKHSDFILGNSSAGVREAPHFGVPCINLGTRQKNRVKSIMVIDADITPNAIKSAIEATSKLVREPHKMFGSGDSDLQFYKIITQKSFWRQKPLKQFIDL